VTIGRFYPVAESSLREDHAERLDQRRPTRWMRTFKNTEKGTRARVTAPKVARKRPMVKP